MVSVSPIALGRHEGDVLTSCCSRVGVPVMPCCSRMCFREELAWLVTPCITPSGVNECCCPILSTHVSFLPWNPNEDLLCRYLPPQCRLQM